MKKQWKPLLLAAFFVLVACEPKQKEVGDMTEAELTEYARGIHERVITLDTHDDINTSNFTAEKNYTQRLSTQVNIPKMEEGGLDVAWLVVYTGQGDLTEEGYDRAYENADDKFKAIHRLTEEIAPDKIGLALTSDDVRSIVASGRKVAMIGVENGYPIGTDISRVKEFYDRGARYMSLAHNGHSQLSDSNTGERDSVWLHNGLSDLGREVIAEMNKWGIMIDLSHPSKVANMEMMKLSKAPVIASHSSARAMNDVSRNLDDEQLMMLKENGGVIQTVAFKSYVNTDKNNASSAKVGEVTARIAEENGFEVKDRSEMRGMDAEAREAYMTALADFREKHGDAIDKEARTAAPAVNVSDFADHIDYLVKKIGLEHVGISSDFDGGGGVEGWNGAEETFNVTLELVRRGYTEEQIGMLWSGNLLRVLDEVQAVAKQIQGK
ncbi:dipeptidase [Roseivirga echinicomitans]|uniref:Peptidase M19 n=1 Tax=Roseivirga echinicomitans TaxID=296218 RepID=A0A150X2Y6_9BACT|nr:membrane dipeptidase [Roseivirga echinicomitans]KYG73090.1 peptidase M19 [Roseivirga echinicomitans]